jgi:AraC-like DNA-binding protein
MIVAHIPDPVLRRAVRSAAHPEEDVVTQETLIVEAVESGFARLVVSTGGPGGPAAWGRVPVLALDESLLRQWEAERRAAASPPGRLEDLTRRLRLLIHRAATDRTWVDTTLAELTRAAGTQLPRPLRTFGRRVMEFPTHYTDLRTVAHLCNVSRGALKAKFRRRGLASPYTYLRWFRIMTVAATLSDRSVTVASAAHRLGFTSDGNLCRMMGALTGLTPTEVRTVRGWNRLLISFAWLHLTRDALEAWTSLEDLFEQRAA